MHQLRGQLKIVIGSVLNRTNFYFLPLAKLTQILKLLDMPQTSEPNTILQYVYTGIIRLYQKYKQKIGSHLFNQKFSSISKDSKELLYSIFLHIHNQLNAKQQTMMHSMSVPPYNMNMIYPQMPPNSINLESQTNSYEDQMKKYFDAAKMYPYYFMNPQVGPSVNSSVNPGVTSSINPTMPSQYGMSMPMPNPYMGYPGTHSMQMPSYGQLKTPPPRNMPNTGMPATGMPFGMNPYSPSTGTTSMYPPQYMNPYTTGLMGGYGQTPPHSFSHMMGLDKSQLTSKTSQLANYGSNNQFEKKYNSSQTNKIDTAQKNDKQKSLSKDPKVIPPQTLKLPYNNSQVIPPSNNVNKIDDKKSTYGVNDVTPKKSQLKDTKRLSEPNPLFKMCACKGYFEYDNSFVCSSCKNKFHNRCLGFAQKVDEYIATQISCAHCKMKFMDPLNKVQQTIGEFYLINLFEKGFQSIVNFKPFQGKCKDKNSKYQIQIRCIRSGQHMKNLQITWPDQCQIKINGQKIVDIPALQSNSSLKKRKDYSVFITQNIYSKIGFSGTQNSNNLQKTKISLQLKPLTAQEANGKRIRNDYIFALGVYFIEKLNTDELYAKIMSEQKCEDKNFLKNLMKTKQDEVQIDKITIKLTDPFSWDLIKTPVRGHKCNHAQCFDLKTFISLMLSAKNRTWKCPLCTRDARKFMLDNQQLQLIKKAQQFDPIPKEVSIFKQGKVAFKIQKDSEDEDEGISSNNKTKKIAKEKKQQVIKQK